MSVHDIATDTRKKKPDNATGSHLNCFALPMTMEMSVKIVLNERERERENELFLLQLLKYDDNLLRIFGAQFSLK